MSGAAFKRGQSKQDYATPPDFMAAVKLKFGKLTTDLAAHEGNKKCDLFLTEQQNSLIQPWHTYEGVSWLNPPFDNIAPWAKKCAEECALRARILFLVPASVGSNWFRDHVHGKAFVYFLNGRIAFDPNNPKWGYPKDCILCVYAHGAHGYETWTWKPQKQKTK